MKNKTALLLTVSVVFALPLLAAGPPRPAGSQATLICRMGGSMVWSVISQLDAVPTEINGKNVRVPVVSALFSQLIFERGLAAVKPNGAGLPPGRCGWTDRAMTAEEPNRVVETVDSMFFQETVQWGNGSTLKGATTMSGGHLNAQNNAVFAMLVTRDASADVQFQVVPGTTPKVIAAK